MIIKVLLYLLGWWAMFKVAYLMLGFVATLELYRRHDYSFDAKLFDKAVDMAFDSIDGVDWGNNKFIRFIGIYIFECIMWPIAFFANASDIHANVIRYYDELIIKEKA